MTLKTVSLDDKYDLGKSLVFLSGIQALVRLMLMQKARDEAAGLNTAGYVSGYRGSPLGGLDQQFERAKKLLDPHHIVFVPGLNEDLAATALWGTQQAEMRGEGAYDGVFGMWYGKGPGVDRCGDVFRHANAAGTSKHGGVLVLMGDDHGAEFLDGAASERVRPGRCHDAGAQPRRRPGDPRLRPARHRHVALFRLLGRPEMHA